MPRFKRPTINKLQPLDVQLQNYLDQLVADLNEALRTRTAEPTSLRDYVTVDYLQRHLPPPSKVQEVGKQPAPTPPPPITGLIAELNQPGEEWYLEVQDWTSDDASGYVELEMRLYDGQTPITGWIHLGQKDFNDKPASFGPFAGSAVAFTVQVRARHVVGLLASPWNYFSAAGQYAPAAGPTPPALPTSVSLSALAHEKEAYVLFTVMWVGGEGVLGAAIYDQYNTKVASTTINAADLVYTFWPVLKPVVVWGFFARIFLLEDPSTYIDSNMFYINPPAPPPVPTSVTLTVETNATHYRFVVSLVNPTDVPDWYEVESQILFKDAVEDPWKAIGGLDPGLGTLTTDWWPRPVETRVAQVRVRSVNPQGMKGEWTYSNFADITGVVLPPPSAVPSVNPPTITYNGDRYGIVSSWTAANGAADYAVWAVFYLPSGALESEVLLGYTSDTSLTSGEWPRPTFRYNVATKVVPRNAQWVEGPPTLSTTSTLNPTADPAVSAVNLQVPVEERSGVPHFQLLISIDIPADLSPSLYKSEAQYYSDVAGNNPISDWIFLGSVYGLTQKTDWWPCPNAPQYVRVRVAPQYDDKWAYSNVVEVPTGKLNLATVQPGSVGPGLAATSSGIQVNAGPGLVVDSSGVGVNAGPGLIVGSSGVAVNPGQGLGLSGGQVVIPTGAIVTPLIADGAIDTSKIMDAAITDLKIVNAAITTDKLADSAVDSNKIADGAITTDKIADSAITTGKLVDSAVIASKIAEGAVITDKIAASAITTDKIMDNAINDLKIVNGAITSAKLANYVVTTDKLGDYAVTTSKLGDYVVTSPKIATSAVLAQHVAAGAIATNHLAAGAVTADKITANAITADKIAANAITSDKITSNAILAGHIAAGAIATNHLAAGAVTADKLAADSVTANKIEAGAVTSDKIAANSILSQHIASGAISADMIVVGSGNQFSVLYVAGSINVAFGDLTFAAGSTGNIYCKNVSASGDVSGHNVLATNLVTSSVGATTINNPATFNGTVNAANGLSVTAGMLSVGSQGTLQVNGIAVLPMATTVGGQAFGQAAFRDVGTGSLQVAAGDHTHTLTLTTQTIYYKDWSDSYQEVDVVVDVALS